MMSKYRAVGRVSQTKFVKYMLLAAVALIFYAAQFPAKAATQHLYSIAELMPLYEQVIAARILSAKVLRYTYEDQSYDCGFVYSAMVKERFKGAGDELFTFASDVAFEVGGEYILFLTSETYLKDWRSVVARGFKEEDIPGYYKSDAAQACRSKLPELYSSIASGGLLKVERLAPKGKPDAPPLVVVATVRLALMGKQPIGKRVREITIPETPVEGAVKFEALYLLEDLLKELRSAVTTDHAD